MLARCNKFLAKHKSLHEAQLGFRSQYIQPMQFIVVIYAFAKAIGKMNFVLAIFFDVSEAFDSLNYNILIAKLKHYGIRGVAFYEFFSYLINRLYFIFVNIISLGLALVTNDVLQVSILGPILHLSNENIFF